MSYQGVDSFCPRCGTYGEEAVYVHGHYQCRGCNCVIDDCCQGERTTAPDKCSINKEPVKFKGDFNGKEESKRR